MKLLNIEKLVESKFLNMYKLKLINRKGNPKDYYVASRRKKKNCHVLQEIILDVMGLWFSLFIMAMKL